MASVSFLMPKILGVADYGYWQLFLLYASYVGFGHFGFNDGVYLRLGGTPRSEVDKREAKGQFLLESATQMCLGIIIAFTSFVFIEDTERVFVLCSVAILLVVNNLANFMGYIFQAMDETRLYSYSIVINRSAFFLSIVILVLFKADSFKAFVVFYILSQIIAFVFNLFNFRDFLATKRMPTLKTCIKRSVADVKAGCKLMLANLASSLILGIAQFTIEGTWGIETFSIYSLAISLSTFSLSFINQVSMVLFPALRQEKNISAIYQRLQQGLDVLLPLTFFLYFPIFIVVSWWLPDYSESMLILPVLLPLCVFDGRMSILSTTYFKVLREETRLLGVNVFACGLSAGFSLLGSLVIGSPFAVVLGGVLAIVCRSAISERYFAHKLNQKYIKSFIGNLLVSMIFLLCSLALDCLAGFVVFLAAYCAWILVDTNRRSLILSICVSAIERWKQL
ncbi:hypothetical protein [Adlercreutzia sp. ZJ473]|uniref:hypothetical protein n=1 Tax=Adlercreutzia sp. ZJ473 TaxID=2722822 RepID=UPI001553D7BF|nr:hypothetical protein [Adlercreutzia sp. ZJ473]